MNSRNRALLWNAPLLALACLTLAVQAGSASAADELTGVVVAPRPGQAAAPLQTGKTLGLPAQQGQQAKQATQATQATALKIPPKLAKPTGIQLGIPAPTLGTTKTVAVGTAKSDVQVDPIQLASPTDRNDVRLKLGAAAGSDKGTSTGAMTSGTGSASTTTGMAGSTPAVNGQPSMAGTGHAQPGAGVAGNPQQHDDNDHRTYCPDCVGLPARVATDTDRALAMQRRAEQQASRLLGEPARSRVNSYALARSNADELAAQSAAIARMRGSAPVEGLSVRNWIDWQFKHQSTAGAPSPVLPGAAPAKVMTVDDGGAGTGTASFDPCNPPPPITGNPEFFQLQKQREDLLGKARSIAAKDSRSPELAQLERDIQKLEEQLRTKDAFLDPCNRDTTRAWNESARAALNLPDRLPVSKATAEEQAAIEEFATEARQQRKWGRDRGKWYYEHRIDGQRDWDSLPDSEKRQWADAEDHLLTDQDDHSLRDWRARADAEEARARDAASAARQAAYNAQYEAEQAEAQAAEAAAAAKRKAEQQRAHAIARRDALDAEARALNQELRSVIANGNKVRQREIEARLDQITQHMTTQELPDARDRAAIASEDTRRMADLDVQRAAAQKQAAADTRQAAIDHKLDLEQQNRNVLTRGSNMAAGFGIAGGKAAVEILQMGLDGVSTGMRAADIGSPGPNRSTIGRLFEDSRTVGDFAGTIWNGCVGMVKGVGTHLMEGDARAFGEDLFNFGSMATPSKVVPKRTVTVAEGVAEAITIAPRTVARVTNRLDIETFRTLSPADQARALAGQSEPVRTGLLQQLSKAEQAAFTEADGALQLGQSPRGLVDCPGDGFVYLTKEGERVIVGDDLVGLSEFENFIPHGTHTAKMTAAEIEALIAKAPPYTSAELLARLDLVYSGRIPRLVMDADTARAMFQVMVEHFRFVNGRLPSPEEIAPLLRALDTTTPNIAAPSVAATVEAPFGYGPSGTIASKPLPKGGVPDWLKAQGVGAGALPPELLQPPKLHQPPLPAPRPDISSMGTVQK